ncbi:MAG TPA: hypothetical protein DCQ06_07755 [Myxococcales bacterium]|nr:hypothetical protein [Myxococcales bacterium]HAN31477.1 hypothetical protein [Myxococcales bacterium]
MDTVPASNLSARALKALPLVISAGLLWLIAGQLTDYNVLNKADLPVLALAVGCALSLDCLIGAFKWWSVLGFLGHRLPFGQVCKIWCGLLPLTFFAPLQSGHALYPVALHRASGMTLGHATESVVVDKGVSLLSTFALIGVGQWMLPANHPLASQWIAIGAWLPVVLWFFDRSVLAYAGRWRFFADRSRLLTHPLSAACKAKLLVIGMIYQCSDSLSAWLACVALGLHIDATLVFGAFPVALLLSYLPITFSGFGVREPATAWALGASITWDQGIWVGALVDVLEYVAPAIAGVLALPWLLRRLAQAVEGADETSALD